MAKSKDIMVRLPVEIAEAIEKEAKKDGLTLATKARSIIIQHRYNRLKERVFQTIRLLGERTTMTYQQLREVFPSDHPEDIINVLEELLREGRISGSPEGYRACLT